MAGKYLPVKSSWNSAQVIASISLEFLTQSHHTWDSPSSWNAASLILVASEVISMASNIFSICQNQWSATIESPPCENRRMMHLKPLEVTRTSLTPSHTSLCNGCSCNTHSLRKGLLVKNRWCLTSTSWMTSTSPSLTCHLHMLNGNKINLISISV